MKNTIFISIDNNFYKLCILFLKNIKKKYTNHPTIHIIYINLTEKQKKYLFKINNNIKLIENDINESIIWPIMLHLNQKKYNPKVFYARFMIFNEYFSQFDKILHLDVDIYINKNLDELFKKDSFFIVKDVYEWHDFIDIDNNDLKKQFLKDKIINTPICWNAWIFLITKKYLNKSVLNNLIEIKNNYSKYIRFADQSIINIWLCLNNINISKEYKYNLQYRLFFQNYNNIDLLKESNIIHLNWLNYKYKYLLMILFNAWFYNLFIFIFIFINKITKWIIAKFIF